MAGTSDNCDVRMKAGHVKSTTAREEVALHPGEKGQWIKKWRRNTSYAVE
jgi:hypothetical protein